MKAIFEVLFEQGQKYALLLPLIGLGAFLVYCYVEAGRPPSGLSLSQIIDLSLIALLFTAYIVFVNFILLSMAFFLLKPIFWALSKLIKKELVFFDGIALLESTEGPLSGMKESFEHVFHRSIGWEGYCFFSVFSIFTIWVCITYNIWALFLFSVAALLFGLFYAFFVVYINRANRFSSSIASERYFLRDSELTQRDVSLRSANALKVVFLALMMFYPVFAMGLGAPVLSSTIEEVGYRASSASVYVGPDYCELISDLSTYQFGDHVGERCVLEDVEVLLYRIGDEVAISLPADTETGKTVVFLPIDAVSVQNI